MLLGRGPDRRFQLVAVRHIDAGGEQIGPILGDGEIFEEIDGCVRRDFDHDVDVAVRRLSPQAWLPNNAACTTPRAQCGLVLFQRGDDVFGVNKNSVARQGMP